MLELKGICYSAEDESRETEILKDIDVTIDDRFVAVTGPNGSGKSTLAKIFDEPEAGIDLWSFQNLIHVFEKMHEEIQGSILIISHQERILNIADRIILLADGQIKKTGSKEEVMPELLGTGAHCKTLTDKL